MMRLLRIAILLLLATVIVAEPVVHTHPFAVSGSGSDAGIAGTTACALCAVAAQQITVVRTNVTAPAVVIAIVVAVSPLPQSLCESRPLASRAPPTA
jgi:hypothetical protein